MVNGIPIYEVRFREGLVRQDTTLGNTFAYAVEAIKGPVNKPILINSAPEAKRIFGLNFAPHFYQKGAPIYICRVEFPEMQYGSITYKAKTSATGNDKIDVIKVTATTPGTAKHKVHIVKAPTSNKHYNLTVTIDGVGSKKYQNVSSLSNVVKRINSKFADYLKAELLIDAEMESKGMKLAPTESLVKIVDGTEVTYESKATSSVTENDTVVWSGTLDATRFVPNTDNNGKIQSELTGGSNGKLNKTDGTISNVEIPASGIQDVDSELVGTGDDQANIDATLLYAYRKTFEVLENKDVLGIATLSNSEVVQNELVESINKLIDPEVYKYRIGVTGLLDYPAKDSNGKVNATEAISISDLTGAATHIDNPFVVMIGQGVKFEEASSANGTASSEYNLLPHEAVQLYTGLRSALNYGEAIYGGNSKKVLIGVKDVLPLVTDGSDIVKEDIESVNESGLIIFINILLIICIAIAKNIIPIKSIAIIYTGIGK